MHGNWKNIWTTKRMLENMPLGTYQTWSLHHCGYKLNMEWAKDVEELMRTNANNVFANIRAIDMFYVVENTIKEMQNL